jgi:hypothetical protein
MPLGAGDLAVLGRLVTSLDATDPDFAIITPEWPTARRRLVRTWAAGRVSAVGVANRFGSVDLLAREHPGGQPLLLADFPDLVGRMAGEENDEAAEDQVGPA